MTLSMFLVQFHFQKSWWHKKVNCLPYDFRKWDLTHIACCWTICENITKSNDACRHNDVIKWKHFLRHWPFVRGIHWSPVNSPQKDQWRGALMFSLICAWIDGWVNNREAGDVIRSRAHYDVNPWSFPWQAALPAWGFSADCLPGDYNIPRNSFNSLADLHEIWHTWHWWAEAIAHQFWVEYDNSEFSVPSMGMFNDLKLFMSNDSVGHLRCVYKSILHKVTAPY